jgi:hypothetical protein
MRDALTLPRLRSTPNITLDLLLSSFARWRTIFPQRPSLVEEGVDYINVTVVPNTRGCYKIKALSPALSKVGRIQAMSSLNMLLRYRNRSYKENFEFSKMAIK